ncbi:MAG: putative RiPP precursor [Allopontixanthobacter sediminis]
MTNEPKEPYVRPVMIEIGSLEKVTQAAGVGTRLDASFSAGTLVSDLTFS